MAKNKTYEKCEQDKENQNCKIIEGDMKIGKTMHATKWCDSCLRVFDFYDETKKKAEKQKPESKQKSAEEKKKQREMFHTDEDIKKMYSVCMIPNKNTHEWLLKKHYAKRVPPMIVAFGLFDSMKQMVGVVTYGPPCRSLNNGLAVFGDKLEVKTMELNRLCVKDNLPRNTLSYFVSETFKLLVEKKSHTEIKQVHGKPIESTKMIEVPVCIVSYADANQDHHGYIYQSTNWLYTGETPPLAKFIDKNTKKQIHARTVVSKHGSSAEENLPDNIIREHEEAGKHRYFMFLGNKNQIKQMKSNLKYEILPYPKGQNKRYDSSAKIVQQQTLVFE